ncbi:sterol desaturase family protein [Bacillus sp. NTK071]|uniref:sterol desaturase family protein n=1 Tax=Bacillus sp. NTK071 TaxID=2802175 RepID=UPI001A8D85DF|nr:sterol desaturase family protein [Bacillus sp. NTK071]MBN8207734.1 sterol desaturase family protein [Bacillus sp. NTK071]
MKKVNFYTFCLYPDIMIMSFLLGASIIYLISHFTVQHLLFVLIGFLIFSVIEYTTHRFFFHLKTPKNPVLLKVLQRLHYDHHKDPNNLHLMFLPIWYTIPQFLLISYFIYLITHQLGSSVAVGLGLMFMLLFYEWKHYIAHQPIVPRTKFGKWLKKTHLLHHYKNENYWYGVTNPFVDIILGTFKDEKTVDKSKTAKSLEMQHSSKKMNSLDV